MAMSLSAARPWFFFSPRSQRTPSESLPQRQISAPGTPQGVFLAQRAQLGRVIETRSSRPSCHGLSSPDRRTSIQCSIESAAQGDKDKVKRLTAWRLLLPTLSEGGLSRLEPALAPEELSTLSEVDFLDITEPLHLTPSDVSILNRAWARARQHNLYQYPSLVTTKVSDMYNFEGGQGIGRQTFFLDEGGRIQQSAQSWVDYNETTFLKNIPSARSNPLTHLLVTGLPKFGKSLILQSVLPAILKSSRTFGVGQPAEALVCYVDLSFLDRTEGLGTFLRGLLRNLNTWAREHGIKKVQVPPVSAPCDEIEEALEEFFLRLPKERLFYLGLDELQAMFLISTSGKLSSPDIARARLVLKRLLTRRSNVLVAVTGSGMALVWSNLLQVPANGVSLVQVLRPLPLPASTSEPAMAITWARLKADYGNQLPDALLHFNPQHVALLVNSVQEFVQRGEPKDVLQHVRNHERTKLVFEILNDFAIFLREGERKVRDDFAALCDDQVGVEPKQLAMWLGSDFLLGPYTKEVAGSQRVYLNVPYHSIIYRTLIDEHGNLVTNPVLNLEYPIAVYTRVLQRLADFSELYKEGILPPPKRHLMGGFKGIPLGRALLHSMTNFLSIMPAGWQKAAWVQQLAVVQPVPYRGKAIATVRTVAARVQPTPRDMADTLHLLRCAVVHKPRLLVQILDDFPGTLELHMGQILSPLSKFPY